MKSPMMREFKEDEVILRQGSTARVMYKILTGKVAVYLNYGQPDEYLVGILSQHRCFGEISILCGRPNLYSIVAIGDVLLLCITEETFSDFIQKNSQNAIDIMKNLANTLATMSFNVNLLTEELGDLGSSRIELPKMKDITTQVQQNGAMYSINKALYTLYV